jgi:hypothetical protein
MLGAGTDLLCISMEKIAPEPVLFPALNQRGACERRALPRAHVESGGGRPNENCGLLPALRASTLLRLVAAPQILGRRQSITRRLRPAVSGILRRFSVLTIGSCYFLPAGRLCTGRRNIFGDATEGQRHLSRPVAGLHQDQSRRRTKAKSVASWWASRTSYGGACRDSVKNLFVDSTSWSVRIRSQPQLNCLRCLKRRAYTPIAVTSSIEARTWEPPSVPQRRPLDRGMLHMAGPGVIG